MTSRNLNTTWRDIIFKQYSQDHAADVPFPVRYLLHNPQWKKDLWYEIPSRIDPATFRRSIVAFHKANRRAESPEYEDANIIVRQRRSGLTASTQTPGDAETLPAAGLDVPEAGYDGDAEPSLALAPTSASASAPPGATTG